MKALTAVQMQSVDQQTIQEIGIPGVVLMENAGRAVAEVIEERFAQHRTAGALVLAGKGNNGGDGYVIARHLLSRGWPVCTLVLAERGAIRGDAAVHLKALENCGGNVLFVQDDLWQTLDGLQDSAVLVDALFGTGLTKPVGGVYAEAIAWLNEQAAAVVSVDISSGVDASTGQILGQAVMASLTVTFAFPKVGQISFPGAGCTGELITADIGIPDRVFSQAESCCLAVDAFEAGSWLPERPADGHKGTFGHLLVLAGSVGKTGAAVMAAESALRGGAGLTTLACPGSVQPVVASQLTEVMTASMPDVHGEVSLQALDDLVALLADKQALAIGPGLGLGEEVGALVRRLLLDSPLPIVVDADGLTALSGHCDVLARRSGPPVVLTPHPGEMARLTNLTVPEIQENRIEVAREFASRYGVVLVLKGARTVTVRPDGQAFVNLSGHAGLGSGGMGDVLTGLIGSFLAQGLPSDKAAALAVYLHGSAADRLLANFGDAGLLATDVMRELPAARQALRLRSSEC